jgi:hypothetical protein
MEFYTANTGLSTSYITVPDPEESVRRRASYEVYVLHSPLRKGVSGGDDGTRYTR